MENDRRTDTHVHPGVTLEVEAEMCIALQPIHPLALLFIANRSPILLICPGPPLSVPINLT